MPTPVQFHILPVRVFRAVCGWAGVFLLLMQVLSPALASPGQSMWMEICSEEGAVWVEVDLNEDSQDPTAPCPKCADCTLCAMSGAAVIPDLPQIVQIEFVQLVHCPTADPFNLYTTNWLWPETRGPPRGPEIKVERVPRASMASFQLSGGAPWS